MADYQPDDQEQTVLNVIKREGRVNPLRIRETTDLRKQYVNDALRQLEKAGLIQKINRGLYEYTGDDAPDLDAARRHVETALQAANRGNHDQLREALENAATALGATR